MKFFYSLVVIAAAFVLAGCQEKKVTEEQAWGQITHFQVMDQPDSLLAALELYLDQHPDGPHAIMVQQLKDRVLQEGDEWQTIVKGTPTREAVQAYLGKYHDGFYRTSALEQLDHLDYAAAVDVNTPEAFDEYLSLHPDGKHVHDAQTRYNRSLETVTKLSEEEEKDVRTLILRHFSALQNADESILGMVAENLSYFGKDNATHEDVLAYMEHMHADHLTKIFKTDSVRVRKVSNQSLPVYNTSFILTEIINPDDSTGGEIKTFHGVATVNSDMRITVLSLKVK